MDVNKMVIKGVDTEEEAKELDEILWQVLWKPIGLGRNSRESFKIEGECIELIAVQNSVILGGLVANRVSTNEVELRHIAIKPEFQRKSIGTMLVKRLIETAKKRSYPIVRTYARNTSVGFFSKMGFVLMPGKTLEHPGFSKHGIRFQQMESVVCAALLKIFPVEADKDLEIVKKLIVEYADFLKKRYCEPAYQHWLDQAYPSLQSEADDLPGDYAAPKGCILLAVYKGQIAGCVCLKPLGDSICEMRRLYVRDEFRGSGIGRALSEHVIEKARRLGYLSMRLSTHPLLDAACAVYTALGFKEIGSYKEVPVPGVIFMELKLT